MEEKGCEHGTVSGSDGNRTEEEWNDTLDTMHCNGYAYYQQRHGYHKQDEEWYGRVNQNNTFHLRHENDIAQHSANFHHHKPMRIYPRLVHNALVRLHVLQLLCIRVVLICTD